MARADQIEVHAVRWPVLDGVSAEGLLLVPREPRAAVVAIPESEWTPEAFCGIGGDVPETSQFPRRLAAAGCLVVVPLVLSRSDEFSGHADLGFTNQSHREVVYRQAFVVGRHLAGYEVQAALAAADLLSRWNGLEPSSEAPRKPLPLGIAGVGEGGRLALYAAALDVRFESTLVSGYFGPRDKVWREPLDRNVWRLLTEFGDAELARLIAPRRLTIEASRCAQVVGPRSPRPGRRASAAPGAIQTPALEAVLTEVDRARKVYERLDREDSLEVETSGEEDGGAGASRAFTCFLQGLKLTPALEPSGATWRMEEKGSAESRARRMIDRERRYFEQLQQHVQGLVRRSSSVRDAMWSMDTLTAEAWPARREKLARETRREFLGELSDPLLPLQVESRRVSETATETVYEVRLEVVPDVIAGGMLVMPKTLTPDVRHPLVVCQHGLESLASDTLASEGPGYSYYKAFSVALARRGYMVFAPQNPYRGGDRFREIQRMTNPLGRTLFSYIIAQHEQLLRWLATLPQVDSRRMAFYGLSYGGKTALRVPPFVEAYSAVICSGDFTDWARAVGANDEKSGYLFTSEYEIPEWNMANRASHAELALLIAPRPFMVEAGYRDSGQPPEWVAAEFSKVRRGYERLGIGSRAELEFFDGPHTIHGEGTFRFLDRHLKSR